MVDELTTGVILPTPTTNVTGTETPGSDLAKTPVTEQSALTAALDTPPGDKTGEVAKPVVPETYADWKLPDGFSLDKAAAAEVAPIFKELGLSQEQGQRLVDFYAKTALATAQANMAAVKETQDSWRAELKADPELGKHMEPGGKVLTTVNSALDGLQNPKLVADFKAAMDFTGAGNNPAFVKVLYALASKLTEGTYVQGQPTGQRAGARPTAGAALYPNLPSASPG